MNYFIFGGSGFIGTHLIALIDNLYPGTKIYNLDTNIRGAENVCAFAEKFGIKKIVFTSSIAPYGAAEDLKTEETLPTPNTPYGISKLVAEKIHTIWQAKILLVCIGESVVVSSSIRVVKIRLKLAFM